MSSAARDWTVLSMLEWGTDYFREKEIPDPRHSIEWLLADVLGIERLDLYLKFDRPLSPAELEQLRPLVKRRAGHEPLQYILGFTDFMNARITVTPDVLIPRIETEQLVEIILADYPDTGERKKAMDIGTGSGCIPVALKMERPAWQVGSFDISEEALAVARRNAEANGVEVAFSRGDILGWEELDPEPVPPYDLVISNPPYVLPEERAGLEQQVSEYEPSLALFSGEPEKMYGSIIDFSARTLTENGRLYLELHERLADEILELFNNSEWEAELHRDYAKKSRFIVAEKRI